jgi:hypothetical protein
MAKFFFHFVDGDERCDDEWGLDLVGPEQAYLEAVAAARAMWAELLAARTDPMRCAFEIEDENGAQLFRLDFSELLDGSHALRRGAGASEVIVRRLEETHRRATDAKAELHSSFDEVYRSLAEAMVLLGRLAAFERPRRGRGTSGSRA